MASVKKRDTWKLFSKFNVFPHNSEHLLLLTLFYCWQPVKIWYRFRNTQYKQTTWTWPLCHLTS